MFDRVRCCVPGWNSIRQARHWLLEGNKVNKETKMEPFEKRKKVEQMKGDLWCLRMPHKRVLFLLNPMSRAPMMADRKNVDNCDYILSVTKPMLAWRQTRRKPSKYAFFLCLLQQSVRLDLDKDRGNQLTQVTRDSASAGSCWFVDSEAGWLSISSEVCLLWKRKKSSSRHRNS